MCVCAEVPKKKQSRKVRFLRVFWSCLLYEATSNPTAREENWQRHQSGLRLLSHVFWQPIQFVCVSFGMHEAQWRRTNKIKLLTLKNIWNQFSDGDSLFVLTMAIFSSDWNGFAWSSIIVTKDNAKRRRSRKNVNTFKASRRPTHRPKNIHRQHHKCYAKKSILLLFFLDFVV